MFQDFKELLFASNAHNVRYLNVGGYVLSFHIQRRATTTNHRLAGAESSFQRSRHQGGR